MILTFIVMFVYEITKMDIKLEIPLECYINIALINDLYEACHRKD